ncbi:MAG: FkbM family methyltransferase [bacterium]
MNPTHIYSAIYQASLRRSGTSFFQKVYAALFQRIRRNLINLIDPDVAMTIHGKTLLMPMSHNLPMFVSPGSLVDTLPTRLAAYIRSDGGNLHLIDIGANIGDTAIACKCEKGDTALVIEPNSLYYPYLQKNLADCAAHVSFSQKTCGANNETHYFSVKTENGTARMVQDSHGKATEIYDLTSICKAHQFERCNLLKIDTDGYDLECIQGAMQIIEEQKPFILFEADVFSNPEYGHDLLGCVNKLKSACYTHLLLYTHLGELFTIVDMEDPAQMLFAIFYQVTSSRLYYDILALNSSNGFIQQELQFFKKRATDPARKASAEYIWQLQSEKYRP